jgi:YfiH family protein
MFLKSSAITANHGFFTRQGGKSEGVFASLNCGLGSGENLKTVNYNRNLVLKKIGGRTLVTAYQCHSATAVIVNGEVKLEADALVTNTKGVALGVLTADCTPILFEDKKNGIIAAAHAGWKGARFGIIASTIRAMQNLGAEEICAAIGPCIRQQSYEVGQEFVNDFLAENKLNEIFFIPSKNNSKSLFDLPHYVESKLRKCGVDNIDILAEDTLTQPKKFYSYRRTTLAGEAQYGRQISVICL